MPQNKHKIKTITDIHSRDGIGIEVYQDDELVLEIFRDDSEKTKTITVYKKDISLKLMEDSIEAFKKEIPWDFQ